MSNPLPHGVPNQGAANTLLSYFPKGYVGTMVEVGAAHPESISTSWPLRQLGWTIISIEPLPIFCDEFRRRGLPILQYACYSSDKGRMEFKISPNLVSSSSLGVRHHDIIKAFNWTDASFQTIEVEALTLNTILRRHHPDLKSFDVLSIDAEGWEFEVLEGFDIRPFGPKIACVEQIATPENPGSLERIKEYMSSNGYELSGQDGVDLLFTPKTGGTSA